MDLRFLYLDTSKTYQKLSFCNFFQVFSSPKTEKTDNFRNCVAAPPLKLYIFSMMVAAPPHIRKNLLSYQRSHFVSFFSVKAKVLVLFHLPPRRHSHVPQGVKEEDLHLRRLAPRRMCAFHVLKNLLHGHKA